MSQCAKMGSPYTPQDARDVAEGWRGWAGETAWTKAADEFGELGGKIAWYCGYPQSKSAIPLTFTLHMPDGTEFAGHYRLKDIRAATTRAQECNNAAPPQKED